jgi:hypothetical protein
MQIWICCILQPSFSPASFALCYLTAIFFWHKCCVLLPNIILCLNAHWKWDIMGAQLNLIQRHKTQTIQFEILSIHLLSFSFLLSFSPFRLFITLLHKHQYTLHFRKFTTAETNVASKQSESFYHQLKPSLTSASDWLPCALSAISRVGWITTHVHACFFILAITRASQKVSAIYLLQLTQQQCTIHKCITFQLSPLAFQNTWSRTAQAYVCH